ncbi:Armadillo-type fold [Phytophthora cinnamomi]|uniref:Armadillo-type fold n=1 Tax=Phytophthora cinnamomi TaxID=4785 RepID=UPI003559E00F|nr:Armadillo-type fold [Phytophthora cinnamomi]
MIELGLRIGKASGALRRGDGLECGLQPDTTICIFEASVVSALKSRTWVAGIKDASQDSGTKSKVSATLLKMDIFFLQIPVTAQSWLKESSLSDVSKDHLKALLRRTSLVVWGVCLAKYLVKSCHDTQERSFSDMFAFRFQFAELGATIS